MKTISNALIATLLTGFALTLATAARAEAPADAPKGDRAQKAEKMHKHFKDADKNGDGQISKEEANASMPRVAKNFDAIDTNKDGQASKPELKAFHQKHGGRKGKQA